MSTAQSPLAPEFATAEEAEAYDRWYREKVQASLDNPHPAIPNDQVMAKMQEIIDKKRRAHAANTVAR